MDPIPPPPSSMFAVKRSFSTPCDPRDEDDGCNIHLSRLAKTPPLTPKKSGKMLALKIQLLDDSVTIIQAQTKALGKVVFDQVCKQLNILEADYFGLEYQDSCGTKYWLDLEKRLSRQVGLSLGDPVLRFSVKFYTPDPSQLEEEFTRYLFSLQIKRDLATGTLQCNDNTASLMASFIVQAECGDFNDDDYPDASYLSTFKFVPHQDLEMEKRIRENHRKHCGQSPAEADLHLLETARRTELYGIKMHPAKDEEGVPLKISVCHLGIIVFQNFTKINTFSWAKIRKLSFKRKRFILKLHPEGYNTEGYYKETVEFLFETRNECKSFWKRCVENHAFFRCEKAPNLGSSACRSKGLLTSRGSSFRYSGRTQKQMVAFVRENFVKRGAPAPAVMGGSSAFQSRSASFRSTHNVMSSASVSGGGGGHHSGVSTSCSSPAMMSAASAVLPLDDQVMDKIYPNMDYPDSPVDIRSQDQDSQQDTLSPGTDSVTSSPQRSCYVPAMLPQQHEPVVPPPPPAVFHPQYPPQGQSPTEYYDEKLSEESEVESDIKLFGSFGQNEFPVTTYKNVERKLKIIESQPMVSLTGACTQQPKEIIRRTRKQRSKSLTVRSEISVSEDDDEINYFTIPRRKEKVSRKKVTDDEFHRPGDETTSQGSYDLLVSNERVDEIPASSSTPASVSGSRRRLIHQKESFYDDFEDPVLSPTTLIAPPLVTATAVVTPPSPVVVVAPPVTAVEPPPPPPSSSGPVSSALIVKKPEEKVRRVLNLKSEEQLVEEAGIWLETGAISTSGSFKRKMKKKQEVIERLESEIITYSHRHKDNNTTNANVAASTAVTHTNAKNKSHSVDTKDFMHSATNYKENTHSRVGSRRPIVHSHSNPIEVDVSVIKSSAFPEFAPSKRPMTTTTKTTKTTATTATAANNNNSYSTVKKVPPETPAPACINLKSIPPDVVQLPPSSSSASATAAKLEENHKNKGKSIISSSDMDENDVILQKPSQTTTRKIKVEMTANLKEIVESRHHETNGSVHPSIIPTQQKTPAPPTTNMNGRETYQIAANEIVSKSFELEPLIEDEFEPSSSTIIDDDHYEKSKNFQIGDGGGGSGGGFSRKNLVRKTKSEGAFDTMCKPSSVLKRSSTERKPGRGSMGGSGKGSSGNVSTISSTDGQNVTKSCIHFEEVDVPYLLRRRIDLESTSSSPGSTVNLYHHHHHESLSKSKSYGGTTSVCDSSTSSSAQQLKRLIYCSMTDLPPVTNFSWRDDTLDCPPIWDETDPFSFAVRRQQRVKPSGKKSIPMEVQREEVETAAADLVDDIMKSANVEFVKDLNEVTVDGASSGNFPTENISTIVEEAEEDAQPSNKLNKSNVTAGDDDHKRSEELQQQGTEVQDIDGKDDEISSEGEQAYEEEEEEDEEEHGCQEQSNFFYESIREEDEDIINSDAGEGVPEKEEKAPQERIPTGTNMDNNLKAQDPDKTMIPEDIVGGGGRAAAGDGKDVERTTTVATEKAIKSTSMVDEEKQLPVDVLCKKFRKDSTTSLDDFPLPPLPEGGNVPDAELEYNCETPRYPPPPPDILQFNYPSRRGSYNRRRSSAEMEQTSMTDSLTTVLENTAMELTNRRLHLSRTFSMSQEDDDSKTAIPPSIPPRKSSISDEANIPPPIQEESQFLPPPPSPLLPTAVASTTTTTTTSTLPSTIGGDSSLSKQSSSDSLPDPPEPLYDFVESRNSDTLSEHSESPEAPLFLNMGAGTIGFPRTLSRISERTHSSEETDSTSQFIEKIELGLRKKLEEATSLSPVDDFDFPCFRHLNNTQETSEDLSGSLNAPLVTLTSELADSSATLNDLDEINNEEVEDFVDDEVENVKLPVELRSEIVLTNDDDDEGEGDDEEENTFGAQNNTHDYDDTTTTSQRHRVEVSLSVRDGKIVFDERQ